MSREPSASSQIKDFLLTLDPDAEFTAKMLEDELLVSGGSVSGFLSKCVIAGAVRVTGKADGQRKYAVVDMSVMNIRQFRGAGSKPGRSHSGVNGSKQVATLLRSLADQVEGFRSGLEDYSNADLLRELSRRERLAAVKSDA